MQELNSRQVSARRAGIQRPKVVRQMSSREKKLPPGQRIVEKEREVDLGIRPPFDPQTWQLCVRGLVKQEIKLTWDEFLKLPTVTVQADLHCVEGWSVVDILWEGPRVASVIEMAGPREEARFVYFECADGYSTSIPLQLAMSEGVILARLRNGQEIPAERGGPIQLVVPDRYGYKWARWVRQIELLAEDRLGYWEQRGYSNTADVWKNDRRASETLASS